MCQHCNLLDLIDDIPKPKTYQLKKTAGVEEWRACGELRFEAWSNFWHNKQARADAGCCLLCHRKNDNVGRMVVRKFCGLCGGRTSNSTCYHYKKPKFRLPLCRKCRAKAYPCCRDETSSDRRKALRQQLKLKHDLDLNELALINHVYDNNDLSTSLTDFAASIDYDESVSNFLTYGPRYTPLRSNAGAVVRSTEEAADAVAKRYYLQNYTDFASSVSTTIRPKMEHYNHCIQKISDALEEPETNYYWECQAERTRTEIVRKMNKVVEKICDCGSSIPKRWPWRAPLSEVSLNNRRPAKKHRSQKESAAPNRRRKTKSAAA